MSLSDLFMGGRGVYQPSRPRVNRRCARARVLLQSRPCAPSPGRGEIAMSNESTETKKRRPRWPRVLVGLAVFLAVLLLVLQYALGPIVKTTAEQLGPKVLGTRVDVTNAHMRILSGLVKLDGVVVGPPEGFDANVFEMQNFRVDLDTSTLLGGEDDPIVIRDITVEGPFVTYELKGIRDNLHKLLSNLGADDDEEKPEEEKKEEKEEKKEGGRKVVIEHFLFKDAKVRVAGLGGALRRGGRCCLGGALGRGLRPLRVERQVLGDLHLGKVSVGGAGAIGLGVPAGEGVAVAREGVGGERRGLADGDGERIHGARAAVGVEGIGSVVVGVTSQEPATKPASGLPPTAGIWSAVSQSMVLVIGIRSAVGSSTPPSWPVRVTTFSSRVPSAHVPLTTLNFTTCERNERTVSGRFSDASTVPAGFVRTRYVPDPRPVTTLPSPEVHASASDALYCMSPVTPTSAPSSFASVVQSVAAGPVGTAARVTTIVSMSLSTVVTPSPRSITSMVHGERPVRSMAPPLGASIQSPPSMRYC